MSPIRRLRRSARLQAALVATPDHQRGCGRGTSDSQPVRRAVKSKGKERAVSLQPTNNNVRTPRPSTAEIPPQETSPDDPVKWDLYPHLTERLLEWLRNNPDDCAILFNEEEDQGTGTGSSAFGGCQLPDHQATYEEEELSGSEEHGMDLSHDLDRDHAMADAALRMFKDEIIHQRPDAYSHQSAQQPVRRATPTHATPEYRASSRDSHFSPYSRLPPSALPASTISSSKLSSTWRHAHSVTPQTSASKGKSLTPVQADHESHMDALSHSATEQRTQIALLRNEHKAMKLQARMRDKEIAHLEAENARDRVEAEKSHQRMMERKRMDIELLQAEARVLTLKVEVAQLNVTLEGLKNSSVCPGA